jgi:O-antigen ligase
VPARVALFALAAGWLYKATILQTWWYSGWAPSWLAVLAITWVYSRRGGFAVTLIAGVIVGLNWDTVYEAIWVGAEQKGDFTRLDIWAQLWELIAAHPILGTGPAGYATYFLSLYPSSDSSKSSHSNYLDVLAQTGILGLVAFCWMLLILAMLAWTARRRWPHGFEGAYATSAIGGFVGLLLAMAQGDWLLPFVYNQTIAGFAYTVHSWVFLGLVAGLAGARPRPAGGHAGRAVATGPSGAQVGSPMLQEDSTARESAQLATSSSPGPGSRAVMRASLAL